MKRGAELGRSYPREAVAQYGNLLRYSQGRTFNPIVLGPPGSGDIENGTIVPVTGLSAFRPGQQILFDLTIYNGIVPPNSTPGVFPSWISSIRLKPWFLRQGDEFRSPGSTGGWTQNDQLEFGGSTVLNNRAVWRPVPKLLDTSQWGTAPPPVAPDRHSDSVFLDDIWKLDLQDPNDAAYQGTYLPGQLGLARSVSFMYVSHGYALGLTYEATVAGPPGSPPPEWGLDLNWQLGTL